MPDSTPTAPFVIAGARRWSTAPAAASSDAPEPVDLHVAEGRIAAIVPAGTRSSPGLRHVDASGAWIGAAFVDPHVHLVMAGLGLRQVDLTAVTDRPGFEAAIERGRRDLEAGGAPDEAWLLARGWDETRWDGRMPAADWLRVAGDRPAAAWRIDIHAAVVNEAGLARLDLSEPVPGGTIERDADGRPTGLLREAAAWERLLPALPPPTPAEQREAVRAAIVHAHARGLVAVGSMEELDTVDAALVPEASEGTLVVRVMALDRDLPLPVDRMRAVPTSPSLRLFAAKAFVDGTLGSRTARLLAPYADVPDERGLFVERALDGTLEQWACEAVGAGLGIAMHAIGDEAVRVALDAADAAEAAGARSGRATPIVRIEHAQHVHAEDVPRFRGRFASMQPAHRMGDRPMMDAALGVERARASFPFAELRAAGGILAFGSDWPVVDCDPFDAIAAAVAGRVRDGVRADGHEIGVQQALHAHTVDAWASIDEPERGRVEPGAVADLVLLDRDPTAVDWSRERPQVLATWSAGRRVAGS